MTGSEIIAADELIREIFEKYNKKPSGWQVAADPKGNALVIGPDSGYRLKLMMVSPTESIGCGARIEGEELAGTIASGYMCGFRPVPPRLISEAAEGGRGFEWVKQVLENDPVPLDKIGSGAQAVLGGPFLQHPDLRLISRRQRELDERLAREVEREFRRRYPLRASIYR